MNPVPSIKCGKCSKAFCRRSALQNHVKRDHQTSVEVTFRSGSSITIEREDSSVPAAEVIRFLGHYDDIQRTAMATVMTTTMMITTVV